MVFVCICFVEVSNIYIGFKLWSNVNREACSLWRCTIAGRLCQSSPFVLYVTKHFVFNKSFCITNEPTQLHCIYNISLNKFQILYQLILYNASSLTIYNYCWPISLYDQLKNYITKILCIIKRNLMEQIY